MSTKPHVTAVTVTYSDRYELCSEVVRGCLREGANRVIVIDNASTPEVSNAFSSNLTRDPRVQIIRLASNVGAAGGFKIGIKNAALHLDTEYLWLLDDDTVPTENALQTLLDSTHSLETKDRSCVLYSFRPRWTDDQIAVSTGKGKLFPRNAYCGFTLTNFFQARLGHHLVLRSQTVNKNHKIIKTEMGPYGGLFTHLKTFDLVGLPNQKFFCYFDDHELSSRINKADIPQYIVAESILDEIDFTLVDGKGLFEIESDFRIYLKIRNQIYLYKSLQTSYTHYRANKLGYYLLFIAPQIIKGILLHRAGFWKRLGLIRSAISNGENGRLGVPHCREFIQQHSAGKIPWLSNVRPHK